MSFASPELLLGLLLVPIALIGYLFVQRRRSRYAVRFTNVDLLSNLVPRSPGWRRHLPPVLYLAAISALAIGLARPSMVLAVPREEATIMLTMDVSRSMRATDVDPNRLTAAQQAATDFVDRLPEQFRIGLVAFSTEARLVVEPTTDRAEIREALAALRADGGTAMGDAIDLALDASGAVPEATPTPDSPASPEPSATPEASAAPDPSASPEADAIPVVAEVVLSDGANSTGALEPIEAAQRAADLGVPIYTIALGTNEGTVDVPNPLGMLESMPVPPDPETLATIAEMTGGRFFEAPTAEELAAIYESLGSKVGYVQEEQEVTQLFAAAGLLFVLVGGALAAHWFNRFP
ncbi:MAG TPA: VWA domain-containing protein [Candidatus Limnocylindrales bacterium]|nr:VWA domain-containing protein [Candidatus Limnocylindrales bacterium]